MIFTMSGLTRDSVLWLILFLAAVVAFLGSHFQLLQAAFPNQVDAQLQSQIELLSGLIGVVAAYLRLSPLPVSDRGREKIEAKAIATAEEAVKAVVDLPPATAETTVTITKENK